MPKSHDVLLGTIIGDISGSRFEILNTKNRDFEFFTIIVDLQMIQ